MPLLDNSFTGVTPNVYLDNKPVDLIAPPIKPFNIELTKEFATKTQIPDNYKRAFESLQSETKSQFIPTGDTFSTKDSNVYGVQGLNFTPGVDNEGIAYLKQDNALSKGVSGMFDVAKASFFSQINTIPNLFSSIVSGEDLFRDNEQNRHLAESLRKLEEDNNKIFKSADQRENPLAPHNIFSKENFSSLLQQTGITVGTIGGILLENLALKVAEAGLVSTGGGAPAAVALEGAEDIRTAIGISKTLGTTGKAIKDILTGVSTLTKSYAAAKGINQAGQMVKALNLTELGVRAFLHANGEAALQKHIAREDIIKSLVDQEGNNLTQEKLDQIHSIAEQGSNTEYYLNLPLLMVSDMYQFGNVLMGKQLNNVLDKFPVSAKLTGGALEFSGKAPSFSRYLTNKTLDFVLKSQTEGLEEIAQYGIENFTRDYYKDLYNKKTTSTAYNFVKYLGKGAESMFNEEGLNQYISGVLIGGITNVGLGAVTSVPQIAANPKRFFTPYSSYKETIENAFSRNNTLGENTLKYFSSVAKQNDAFQQGDKAKFNDELAKQIFDFTDTSLKRGTFGHIIDTIKSWSTLENEQFNASGFAGMGENLNPDQQRIYINSLLDKINLAKEAVENTQRVFKVNPFEKENWFVEKIKNRGKTDEEILSQDLFKAQSSHIFNQLRNVAAYLTFKKENQSTRFEGLTTELNNEFNPKFVENMLGDKPSVKNYLLDQLKQFEQELAIYEEGVDPKSINSIEGVRDRKNTLKKLIDSINSVKDKPEEELVKVMSLPEEVKGIITNAEMSIEDFNKASEKLIDSYKLKQSINTLNKIYKSWGTIEGQTELINSILDHSVYSPTETSKPQVTPKTETPETTVPKQEMSLADMLSSIPLADATEYSIEPTEPYYVDDEDMSFPVEEYSSSQEISQSIVLQNKQESKNMSLQSEIENKKADIERRRQEELKQVKSLEQTPEQLIRNTKIAEQRLRDAEEIFSFGNTYSDALDNIMLKQKKLNEILRKREKEETKNRDFHQWEKEELEKQPEYQENKRLDKIITLINEVYTEGKSENFNNSTKEAVDYEQNELNNVSSKKYRNTEEIRKINAKYDAELAALESNVKTTPNTTKADIERRRQEELNPITTEIEKVEKEIDEIEKNYKTQGAYAFSASSNSGKWNSANNELLDLVQDNRKAFAIYKFLIGDMETFKEIVDFLNERGIEIPYTDRMKRADETMTVEERKSAIDSYNDSVDSKTEDKAQIEKNILSENNLQDETEYTPQELIEKYPLTGVQKLIWNLIKDIVNKLGIKVKFSSSRITEGFDGSNNPQNGEILIRPSTLKNGRFGEVLVHEIVHALTTKIISRVNSGVTTGLTQKQINAVNGLMKLFKAVKADNNLENKYPVKDVFEFIAHLTNDTFVKELESKDKSFLQKVVDFIADILGITNANELTKQYLKDIISDGTFLQEQGITVVASDYSSNLQGNKENSKLQELKNKLKELKQQVSKINAKHDAEYINKVKKGELTKQQAKDALKEIGRLTLELEKLINNAELESLNNQITPQQKQQQQTDPLENKDLKDNKNLNTIESVINQIKDCKS